MTKTVLVVDDDPTQRRLIQAVLERDGFVVASADSGGRRWTGWSQASWLTWSCSTSSCRA